MIEDIEARVKADLESGWPEAEYIDKRANVGFSDGKTTSYTFRIHTEDRKHALTVGPRAVREGDFGRIRSLAEQYVAVVRKARGG